MNAQKVISLLTDYAAQLRRQKEGVASGGILNNLDPYAALATDETLQEINEAIVWLKKRARGKSKGQNKHVHAQAG